ncbi:uncharacterized protein [Diabrotica undecimpunctata]|uniref:uncharacterized protein n=1 Tax=Diabrotica undecimpunctata TaxID=50387 RepID=UPI003B6333A3
MRMLLYLPADWYLFFYYSFIVSGVTNVLGGIFKTRSFFGVSYQTHSVYVLWFITTLGTYLYPKIRLSIDLNLVLITGLASIWITALFHWYRRSHQHQYEVKLYGLFMSIMVMMLYLIEDDFSKVLELSSLAISVTVHIPQVIMVLRSKKITIYIFSYMLHLLFAKICFLLHATCGRPKHYGLDLIHGILGLLSVVLFIPLYWICGVELVKHPTMEIETKTTTKKVIKLIPVGRLYDVCKLVAVVTHKDKMSQTKIVQQKQSIIVKPDIPKPAKENSPEDMPSKEQNSVTA